MKGRGRERREENESVKGRGREKRGGWKGKRRGGEGSERRG